MKVKCPVCGHPSARKYQERRWIASLYIPNRKRFYYQYSETRCPKCESKIDSTPDINYKTVNECLDRALMKLARKDVARDWGKAIVIKDLGEEFWNERYSKANVIIARIILSNAYNALESVLDYNHLIMGGWRAKKNV